jgi:hypothetical protein
MKVLIPNDGTIDLAYKTDHVMLKSKFEVPELFHFLLMPNLSSTRNTWGKPCWYWILDHNSSIC